MKNKKKGKATFSTKEVSFLVVITCLLSFVMAMLLFNRNNKKEKNIDDKNLSLLIEQYNYIMDHYYETVDKEKLIDGAIMGMLYGLGDPYAEYYDEISANSFNARLNGYFDGVGVEIVKLSDGTIGILTVFEGSSAYENGLKPGDIILSIDGINVSEMSQDEFLKMIKNKQGTVKLKIKRNDEEKNFELKKSTVTIDSVSSKIIDDKYGYIKIDIFAINTYSQFKKAFEEINNQKISGLIIDLRDNSGGHLTTAENLLSLLLDSDKVIYQISNSDGTIQKEYSNGTQNYDKPIVVLCNKNSASASELVTAALKEQLNAGVIGETTYGKGTVQEMVDLPSGKQYKMTTKQWLTSNGNKIDGNGVEPTISLTDLDDEQYISEAIKYLKNKN